MYTTCIYFYISLSVNNYIHIYIHTFITLHYVTLRYITLHVLHYDRIWASLYTDDDIYIYIMLSQRCGVQPHQLRRRRPRRNAALVEPLATPAALRRETRPGPGGKIDTLTPPKGGCQTSKLGFNLI
jgi:hypothetical protein